MLSLKYFLRFILLNLTLENFANAQNPPNDVYQEDPKGFISVIVTGHVFIFFALVGILFMLDRIYYRWSQKQKSLSMALRVPFYLCMLDLFFIVFQIPNVTYVAIHHTTLPEPACKIVAVATIAFTIFHRLVVVGISIITYFRVCKQKVCNTGRYDWKLFIFPVVISLFISIIALDTYGPVIYWCASKPKTIASPITSILITLLVLSICLFCYIQIVRAIREVKNQHLEINRELNSSSKPISDIEIKVTIKVLGYILVFIVQWVPAITYDIYQLIGIEHSWVYCMVIVSINLGPIGNTISFLINEGWSRHKDSNFSQTNNQFTGSNVNHSCNSTADSSSDQDKTIVI